MLKKIALIVLAVVTVGCSSDSGPSSSSKNVTPNQVQKNNYSPLKGVVVKDSLEEFQIEIKNPGAVAEMINNSLLLSIDGAIIDIDSLLNNKNEGLQSKASCKFVDTGNEGVDAKNLEGLVLHLTSSYEIPADTEFGVARHIFIVSSQEQVEIGCTKYEGRQDNFTWYEVQRALGNVVEIGPKP